MDRRKILKYVAYATGAAVSAPLVSSLLVSCQSDAASTTTASAIKALSFFNKKEFAVITDLVDVILPKTDSPSATDIGVHTMIDQMVGTAYRPKEKEEYQSKFAAFYQYLTDKGIADMDGAAKMELLQALGKAEDASLADAKSGFLNLRQQAIAYYLSSEEIGLNYLTYLPVPGQYESCISVEEAGGKAWAI